MFRNYEKIGGQISDVMNENIRLSKLNKPWTITNNYPWEITVYIYDTITNNQDFHFKIGGKGSKLEFKSQSLRGGCVIIPYFLDNGKLVQIAPHYVLNSMQKNIAIGNVVYTTEGGNGNTQASNYDTPGVTLVNKSTVPLIVVYNSYDPNMLNSSFGISNDPPGDTNSQSVLKLEGNLGMNLKGGGGNEIYFTNSGQGVNISDYYNYNHEINDFLNVPKFDVYVDLGAKNLNIVKFLEFTITDEQARRIEIGGISADLTGSTENLHRPDNSLYRVNVPNKVDLTYYTPTCNYHTEPTKSMMYPN